MAALPSIQNFDRDLGQLISGKLDDALEGIVERFSKIGDDISGQARTFLGKIKEPFVSIRDAMKINITGRAMDRVRQLAPLPGLRRKDPLEESVNALTEVSEKGFKETVDSLNKIEEFFRWDEEKRKAEEDKFQEPEPEPTPEEPKDSETKSFGAMFMAGMKNFLGKVFTGLLRLGAAAGLAVIIGNGLRTVFDDVGKGIENSLTNGHAEETGAIRGLLLGFQDDLMSRINALGRWAGIGAAAGIVGGIPGIITGGLIGAALGGAVMGIDYLFGDYIDRTLDAAVDGLATAIETFTGGDSDRIKKRLSSLNANEDRIGKELEAIYDRLEALQKELADQEAAGNDARANRIRREITKVKAQQEEKLKEFDSNRNRIRGFEKELAEADMGFIEKVSDRFVENNQAQTQAIKDAIDWMFGEGTTASVDKSINDIKESVANYVSESWEMFKRPFVQGWNAVKGVWNDGMDYLDKEIERTKAYWAGLYDEAVNNVVSGVDSIGKFLTETIPETIGGFFDNLKSRLQNAFAYVKELGKIMYEEISFSDFNPLSDGPSYGERINARLADFEASSRIRENSERQNANAEATFNVINESADKAFERAVQASVGVQNNQSLTQNSYYYSGISVRDKDPASLKDAMIAGGFVMNT